MMQFKVGVLHVQSGDLDPCGREDARHQKLRKFGHFCGQKCPNLGDKELLRREPRRLCAVLWNAALW